MLVLPQGGASIFFALLFFLAVPSTAEVRWLNEFSSRSYAEPLPIKQFAGDWQGQLKKGTQAFTRNRFSSSLQQGDFAIGYIQRYDWQLDFSRDTARLYYLHENDLPLPPGRLWQVDLRSHHLRADGVRFAWQTETDSGWSRAVRLSLLHGMALQDGRLNGQITEVAGDYQGVASIDYHYHKDMLLADPAAQPQGQGWALDLQLGWHSEQRGWQLQAEDVLAALYWQHTPYTQGDINTATAVTDPNGFIDYNPTFSGIRKTHGYRQDLPAWYRLEGWQQHQDWRLSLVAEYLAGGWWPEIAVSRPLGRHLQMGWGWLPLSQEWRWRLSDSADHWHVQLGADHWRMEKAHALLLQAGLNWTF